MNCRLTSKTGYLWSRNPPSDNEDLDTLLNPLIHLEDSSCGEVSTSWDSISLPSRPTSVASTEIMTSDREPERVRNQHQYEIFAMTRAPLSSSIPVFSEGLESQLIFLSAWAGIEETPTPVALLSSRRFPQGRQNPARWQFTPKVMGGISREQDFWDANPVKQIWQNPSRWRFILKNSGRLFLCKSRPLGFSGCQPCQKTCL